MNLHLCAILNCNTGGDRFVGWEKSASAQRRANLIEQLAQTRRIAGRAAEACVSVELREFVHGWRETRRIHGCRELERRLRRLAPQSSPRQRGERIVSQQN